MLPENLVAVTIDYGASLLLVSSARFPPDPAAQVRQQTPLLLTRCEARVNVSVNVNVNVNVLGAARAYLPASGQLPHGSSPTGFWLVMRVLAS